MTTPKPFSVPFCFCAGLFLFATLASYSHAAEKPNVVFIFIDDMGYGDIGPLAIR